MELTKHGWHHQLSGKGLEQTREIVEDGGAWCAVANGGARHDSATEEQHNMVRQENINSYSPRAQLSQNLKIWKKLG